MITRGQAGGYAAAQTLSDTILHFLTSNYGGQQYQLWVYIYFNKRGLLDAFGRAGNPTAKTKFEDFYMGFNEAAERFLMVDVGSGKEAADAKLKGRSFHPLHLQLQPVKYRDVQRISKLTSVYLKPTRSYLVVGLSPRSPNLTRNTRALFQDATTMAMLPVYAL